MNKEQKDRIVREQITPAAELENKASQFFASMVAFMVAHKFWVTKNDNDRLVLDMPVELTPEDVIDAVKARLKRSGIDMTHYFAYSDGPHGSYDRIEVVFPADWIVRLLCIVSEVQPTELWSL